MHLRMIAATVLTIAILTTVGVAIAQEPAKPSTQTETKPYELRLGDVIQISVGADARLDGVHVIRPDGRISIKLVGEVMAEGLTVECLRAAVTEKVEELLLSPKISVKVLQVAKKPAPAK